MSSKPKQPPPKAFFWAGFVVGMLAGVMLIPIIVAFQVVLGIP